MTVNPHPLHLPADDVSPDLPRLVREMLEQLGEDSEREGLIDTPRRVASAMEDLTSGYQLQPRDVVGSALFAEDHTSVVTVRGIEFHSLCEHHLLPFFGTVDVAYLPAGRVIGLSKLPRLVDVFARRLLVQERMTDQIAAAVEDVLAPAGVAIRVEARHLCMMMRGVQSQGSVTSTLAFRGVFETDRNLQNQFTVSHSG